MMAKEKPPITVVGDVGGRIAIIVVRFYDISRLGGGCNDELRHTEPVLTRRDKKY